jgi:hypothetical protein
MNKCIAITVLVFCLFCERITCITTTISEYKDTKSFTTTGTPHLENIKATVLLPHHQDKSKQIKCEFRFSTIDCEDVKAKLREANMDKQQQQQQQQVTGPTKDYSQLQLIQHECLTKIDGYWTYKFCVGESVTQTHGSTDTFVLGRFSRVENDKEYFNDGTLCTDEKSNKRETIVQYMCGKSAAIISVREPQTCIYEATVTHPSLCGEKSAFTEYSGSVRDFQTQIAQNPLDYWVLSLERTTRGNYLCSLKSVLRDLKQKMSTCFSSFSLATSTVTGVVDGEEKEVPHQIEAALARQEERQKVNYDELYEIPGGMRNNVDKFVGFLEYAHVKTKEQEE